jgi:MFS family permease
LILSVFAVRESHGHARHEAASTPAAESLTKSRVFARASFADRDLSAVSQAGLVNNLNDGMAWGLFPMIFAASGAGLGRVGVLAAIYPALWAVGQLVTGGLSDRLGRKWLIASGMWVQAAGIAAIAVFTGYGTFVVGSVLLGIGTAMVYPTLLSVIGDVAHPSWRASAVGVYRFWRDLGYAAGALVSGIAADLLGTRPAVGCVAFLTLASGVVVAIRLRETRPRGKRIADATTGASLLEASSPAPRSSR